MKEGRLGGALRRRGAVCGAEGEYTAGEDACDGLDRRTAGCTIWSSRTFRAILFRPSRTAPPSAHSPPAPSSPALYLRDDTDISGQPEPVKQAAFRQRRGAPIFSKATGAVSNALGAASGLGAVIEQRD